MEEQGPVTLCFRLCVPRLVRVPGRLFPVKALHLEDVGTQSRKHRVGTQSQLAIGTRPGAIGNTAVVQILAPPMGNTIGNTIGNYIKNGFSKSVILN